jgi:PIN domain nuclease of toxin-antitoxin system
VILLDSTALVAAFLGEPAAQEVESMLREVDTGITSPNLAEVIDVLVRVFGNDLEAVEAKLVPLLATTLSVKIVGEAEARRAAQIRIMHYHRRDNPLSLGDCLLLGTAIVLGPAAATSDISVARSARSEGLEVIALRDPLGKRP